MNSFKNTLSYDIIFKDEEKQQSSPVIQKPDLELDLEKLVEEVFQFSDMIEKEGNNLLKDLAEMPQNPSEVISAKHLNEAIEKTSAKVRLETNRLVDEDIEEYKNTESQLKDLESTISDLKDQRKLTVKVIDNDENEEDESLKEYDVLIKDISKEKDELEKLKKSLKEKILKTRDTIKLEVLKTVDFGKVLNKDMRTSAEKKVLEHILKEEKEAKSLDLCIMIDCTFSMQEHIDMAREKIIYIVSQVKKQFLQAELRVGVVGYRDVFDEKRFEILQFTSDVKKVTDFLEGIKADGGLDGPEDVNGGFQEALRSMYWEGFNRTILHIADAPCHGIEYHDMGEEGDYYPGGYADDMRWEAVFDIMKDKRLNYLFLKIENVTDIMFEKFKKIWDEGLESGLTFEQEVIENDAKRFTEVTIAHMTKSISTGIKETYKALKNTAGTGFATKMSKKPMLLMIGEEEEEEKYFDEEDDILETEIVCKKPAWESNWFLPRKYEGTTHYITKSADLNLESKINGGSQSFTKEKVKIKLSETPFSKGEFSRAYYCQAKPENSKEYFNMVLKKSIEPADKKFYFSVLDKNTIAASLAKEYNEQLEKKKVHVDERLYFTRVLVLNLKNQYYLLEAYIPGNFQKYTNNYTYVNESVPLLTAFSHFTYHITEGKYMVTDLQGVDNLLTDPVVHSFDRHFKNQGDLGQPGMIGFFRYHECNKYCKMLGLPEHVAQKNKVDKVIREPVEFNLYRIYKKCNYYFCNNNSQKNPLCYSCNKNVDFSNAW